MTILDNTDDFPVAKDGIVNNIKDNEADTPKVWLDISEISDFMSKVAVIDTDVFKNFKIVLEYTNDVNVLSSGLVQTLAGTVQPTLSLQVADDKTANASMAQMKAGLLFNSIERDNGNISAITPADSTSYTVQQNKIKFNGFNKKYVKRFLLQKEATVTATLSTEYGKLGSETQLRQKLQPLVNGVPHFPSANGIERDNERLALLNDTWGVCNTLQGHQLASLNDSVNYLVDPADKVGHLDYFAWRCEDRVNKLELNYERSGRWTGVAPETNDRFNQALNLRVFGEVPKMLKLTGDKYLLSYK